MPTWWGGRPVRRRRHRRIPLRILGLPIRRTCTSKWYFSCVDEAQRLREVVLESLDQEQDANGLARHAYRSRTQFYRVFRAMIEETPVAMRRRLLLERAAWQLSRTQLSVTDISLNANYGSLEAFTRAFRKAFGVSPSLYRRMGATYTHLHAANGIHHHSGKDDTKGAGRFMDLFDIFSGQESWHTRRLLDLAKTLNDEQLGPSVAEPGEGLSMGWPGSEPTPDSGPDGADQGSLGRGADGRQHAPVGQCPAGGPNSFGHAGAAGESGSQRSTAYSPMSAIEALGRTRLSMRCANRRRPSPLAECSRT